MTLAFGALGQSAPAATTLTAAYTVPAAKRATVSVFACNRGAATTIRVSLAPEGATDATTQYLLYDFALDANDTVGTMAFTAATTAVVRVYSASGNVTFTVNGIEETA